MKILINQQPLVIKSNPQTALNLEQALDQALAAWQQQQDQNNPSLNDGFAVAINQQFIPKNLYPSTLISEGDEIELLVAMQGG